jgi:hypothetical protein
MNRLKQAAHEWMDANPEAMAFFRSYAKELLARRRRFGIALLAERVRWEMHFATHSEDGYRINNNHKAYIARVLIAEMPGLKALIKTRCCAGEYDDHD